MKKMNVPFDQFQRYKTFEKLIRRYQKDNYGDNSKLCILELGANEHKDLSLFLPDCRIVFSDIELTEEMKADPDFVEADGTDLPFGNNSFDFVVAADVLEHVPRDKRRAFLSEAYRVASKAVIVCFPMNSAAVRDAEERVNSYYKALSGEDFIWLKEHRENGLPNKEEIDRILKEGGIPASHFYHGDIETWEKLWYCHFNTVFMPKTLQYRKNVDYFYAENLYKQDVSQHCYRVFYTLSKEKIRGWDSSLKTIWEKPDPAKRQFLDILLNRHMDIGLVSEQIQEESARNVSGKDTFQLQGKIYFDMGTGFSEEESVSFSFDSREPLNYRCDVPDEAVSVRFDPIENSFCILRNIEVLTDHGFLEVSRTNGELQNGLYMFCTADPQIEIDLPGPTHWLRIQANCFGFDNMAALALLNDYSKAAQNVNTYRTDRDSLAERLAGTEAERNGLAERLACTEAERDSLTEQLADMETEHNGLAERLAGTEAERDSLTEQLAGTEAEHNDLAERLAGTEAECDNLTERLAGAEAERDNLTERLAGAEAECDNLTERLAGAEAECDNLTERLAGAEAEHNSLTEQLTETYGAWERDKAELGHYKEHYLAAINQREELKREKAELEQSLAEAQYSYSVISNAACWKMTKPLRAFLDFLKRIPLFFWFIKAIKCWKDNGWRYTWRKIKEELSQKKRYSGALQQLYNPEELERQRRESFARAVKISIVVPLFNTPPQFLNEMIQSVLDQTYGDWELCMADGSDKEHAEVQKICKSYAKKEPRIKYKKLKENLGISGNTNVCLDMATGDYIALFDHDDLLHPAALYEVMHAICDQDADFVYTDENTFHKTPEDAFCPHFKPDFAPDTLRSYNYICHLSVFSKELINRAGGGFRSKFDGSQDYDMILRLTEKAKKIVHIPKILYYWRSHEASVASGIEAKPYTLVVAKSALADHLERVGLKGEVRDARIPSTYNIQYELNGKPLISILIPNKDHRDDLKKCIDSIREKSSYQNWEIIVVENNSMEPETFDYYKELGKDKRIRIVYWKNKFNYSAINNFGAGYAKGKHLLLLNNDIEVITSDWIEQILMFSQREDVGAVGAMLYYPDDTVQHAGVVLGIGGVGGHAHKYFKRGDYGYMSRMAISQNYSAVTAACMMIRRDVWEQVGGLDESFAVAFNDVDLCMRIRQAGYLIVWTPFAELYHYESKSRGLEDTPEKQKRFQGEVRRFQERWAKELAAGDPYYNPNFTLDREDFSLR